MNQKFPMLIITFLVFVLIILKIKNRSVKQKVKNKKSHISDEIAEAMASKIKFESEQHRMKK